MASTPSPAHDLPSTPPAPKYGSYEDHWEPYQPRKSARLSSQAQRATDRTPSPSHATRSSAKSSKSGGVHFHPDSHSSGCSTKTGDSKNSESKSRKRTTTSADMLPTPTKTPRRAATSQQIANMGSVSRNIFPTDDDLLLNDRSGRTPKKLTGSTLESFVAEDADQDFAIFNDSCNRIPEKDESNPFYNPAPAPVDRRQRKRKMVRVPGEGSQPIEDAVGRQDGLVMKFRGRTVYRQFAKPVSTDSDGTDELAAAAPTDLRSNTASNPPVPKLLWPKQSRHEPELADEDEEAATDVEDMNTGGSDSSPVSPVTPASKRKTPQAPKFAPFSPPSTQRATRSADKLSTSSSSGRISQPKLNYNKWGAVAKSHKSALAATKRSGEPLDRDNAKRTRASSSQVE